MAKIEVKLLSEKLRVFVNDTLHLSIDIKELVGIQSYKYDDYWHAIDYHMKTTMIETWYANKDDWKTILDGLAKIALV